MASPDYFRFLIVLTTQKGKPSIIFTTDKQEEAEAACVAAYDAYKEEREAGSVRVDMYKIF